MSYQHPAEERVFPVHDGQDTVEENCPPIANEPIDPEQSDTTHGEATEKTGGDVTRRRSSSTNFDDVGNNPATQSNLDTRTEMEIEPIKLPGEDGRILTQYIS